MVIRQKIFAAMLAATLTMGSAMPAMAAQTVAMTKEKGTWEADYYWKIRLFTCPAIHRPEWEVAMSGE